MVRTVLPEGQNDDVILSINHRQLAGHDLLNDIGVFLHLLLDQQLHVLPHAPTLFSIRAKIAQSIIGYELVQQFRPCFCWGTRNIPGAASPTQEVPPLVRCLAQPQELTGEIEDHLGNLLRFHDLPSLFRLEPGFVALVKDDLPQHMCSIALDFRPPSAACLSPSRHCASVACGYCGGF